VADTDQPKDEDIRRLRQVLEEVRKTVEQFRANTEAAVIAGALANLMRELVDAYPPVTRDALMEGMIAFLQHRDVDAERRQAELAALGFVLPKGVM